MIQKTMDSSSIHPFRPPKSPSSIVVHNKTAHVVTPKSPPRRNRLRKKVSPQSKLREDEATDALSPTSVVNPRGLFREQTRSRPAIGGGPANPKAASKVSEADGNLVQAGNQCLKEGNVVGAIFAYTLLVDERKRTFGPNHRHVGAALNDLGMVHLRFGDYKQAEKEFARAAAIQIRSKKAHPLDIVKCLINLGQSRLMRQKREGALSVFRDAVKIVRTKLGHDEIHVAEVQSQIGYLLFQAGDLSAALHAFADALAVHRSNDLNQAAVAETLCNIGSIHLKQNSFDPAIYCFLEALQLQRETCGDFHPDVIVTLDNLAFVHTKKRDYDKALKYYNETLQSQVAFYGAFTQECAETKQKEQIVFKKYCRSRCARERAQTA